MEFKFRDRLIDCGNRTRIMGVLNVTPDSFSDGNAYASVEDAYSRVIQMRDEGADIIDIGGESSRPGASPVSVGEELARVLPVLRLIKKRMPDIPVSIDTTKSAVASVVLDEGADIINDISGLNADPEIANLAADSGAGLVLMHMRGSPATMNSMRDYNDLVPEVARSLLDSADKAIQRGVHSQSIMLDPGIGFAKTPAQSIEIMRDISKFMDLGYPLLVGPSRKSFIGEILSQPEPGRRVWGTAGAIAWLALQSVHFVRVHDVAAMRDVISVVLAIDGDN